MGNQRDTSTQCSKHGSSKPVLACTHIVQAKPSQFFSAIYEVPADHENDIQAWCQPCEDARILDKGWYGAADAVADWTFVCTKCYTQKLQNCEEIICYESDITPDEKPG